ncbi:putative bifunctional diguanylate cyclase/phosphodiesterase [Viridibacillus arvi]|uniref:putative bifunctional diguanylate cyclase/phosphodiesterase n=1 Tax=Viridibacillus arvi TaxID=263475 RepID=UPI003D05AC0B
MYNSSLSPQQYLDFIQKFSRLYPESMTMLIEQDSSNHYWITYVNESFKTFFEYTFEHRMLASSFFTLQMGTNLEDFLLQVGEVVEPYTKQITIRKKTIQHSFNVRMIADTTTQHKVICLTLSKVVSNESPYHDQLTGIWNKRALQEHFKEEERIAKCRGHQMAILLLDLDRFKKINDSIGFNKGDELLKKVVQRLSTLSDANRQIYRQNGDDFIFLLQQSDVKKTEYFADKVLALFKKPFCIDELELNISGSIGGVMYPADGAELDELLKKAGQALRYVKERVPSTFRFYHSKMLDTSNNGAVMESHLRRAIEKNELSIHYQPQVDLDTGKINSFEALLRWNNPKFGSVPPSVFIPIAEDSGLILEIGDWVLNQVCIQLKEWQINGFIDVRIAVNISSKQFKQEAFANAIKKYIYKYELNPQSLELEITESSMTNIHETLAILQELKKMGVIISIDDFGTGYSSLSYLKRYPIDIIKIDQSFIKEIEQDEKDEAIAKTIIHLAHSLGMKVIAEGVEKKDHVEILKKVNCEKAQGYYFSRPVPIESIIEMYFC